MGRIYKRKPGSRRYNDFRPEQLKNALEDIQSNKLSINAASKEYGISRATLQRKVRGLHSKPFGGPTVLGEETELSLVKSILTCAKWGYPLSLKDIRIFVKHILDKKGAKTRFVNNKPGYDWAKSFLKRHKDQISERMAQNIKRSRAAVSPNMIKSYCNELKETLKDVPAANILNYDETNLSDDPGRSKLVFKRGTKYPERVKNHSKSATSVMYACSADGTVLPSYVVYKAVPNTGRFTH